MSAILKHTLCHLTLVVLLYQYISAQLHPNPRRARFKRAVIQDAESNGTVHPTATVEFVTLAPNVTLTSQERLEQLGRLKEAEMHLRKNLKERGKEYENQLYENWPNMIKAMESLGPKALLDPNLTYLMDRFHQVGITYDMLVENWNDFLIIFKEKGGFTFLKMMDTYKKDEDAVTFPPGKVTLEDVH